MHDRTRATLDELDRADWFSAVGRRMESEYADVLPPGAFPDGKRVLY
jgi:hypothetical protein